MITVEASDVGLRRTDTEVVDGVERFAVVADTGTGCAYVRVLTDWRSPAELQDFAARVIDASTWLQGQ
jgi:hypothetical protein